jgi:alcohol dehydrogenase class IV
LRDIGIKQEQLRGLAEKTFGIKRILRVNPRSVTVEEIEGIFNEAY